MENLGEFSAEQLDEVLKRHESKKAKLTARLRQNIHDSCLPTRNLDVFVTEPPVITKKACIAAYRVILLSYMTYIRKLSTYANDPLIKCSIASQISLKVPLIPLITRQDLIIRRSQEKEEKMIKQVDNLKSMLFFEDDDSSSDESESELNNELPNAHAKLQTSNSSSILMEIPIAHHPIYLFMSFMWRISLLSYKRSTPPQISRAFLMKSTSCLICDPLTASILLLALFRFYNIPARLVICPPANCFIPRKATNTAEIPLFVSKVDSLPIENPTNIKDKHEKITFTMTEPKCVLPAVVWVEVLHDDLDSPIASHHSMKTQDGAFSSTTKMKRKRNLKWLAVSVEHGGRFDCSRELSGERRRTIVPSLLVPPLRVQVQKRLKNFKDAGIQVATESEEKNLKDDIDDQIEREKKKLAESLDGLTFNKSFVNHLRPAVKSKQNDNIKDKTITNNKKEPQTKDTSSSLQGLLNKTKRLTEFNSLSVVDLDIQEEEHEMANDLVSDSVKQELRTKNSKNSDLMISLCSSSEGEDEKIIGAVTANKKIHDIDDDDDDEIQINPPKHPLLKEDLDEGVGSLNLRWRFSFPSQRVEVNNSSRNTSKNLPAISYVFACDKLGMLHDVTSRYVTDLFLCKRLRGIGDAGWVSSTIRGLNSVFGPLNIVCKGGDIDEEADVLDETDKLPQFTGDTEFDASGHKELHAPQIERENPDNDEAEFIRLGLDSDDTALQDVIKKSDTIEFAERLKHQPLPNSKQGFNSHPSYILKSGLKYNEVFYPPIGESGNHPVALFKGDPVYSRAFVHIVHNESYWVSMRRELKQECKDFPAKMMKPSALSFAAQQHRQQQRSALGHLYSLSKQQNHNNISLIPAYGIWQTNPIIINLPQVPLPVAKSEDDNQEKDVSTTNKEDETNQQNDEIIGPPIPLSRKRGDVFIIDLSRIAEPPPGTIHIRISGAARAAKKLHLPYALALVKYDFSGRVGKKRHVFENSSRAAPVYEGVVVHAVHEHLVRDLAMEGERLKIARQVGKDLRRGRHLWKGLLRAMLVGRYMNLTYGEEEGSLSVWNVKEDELEDTPMF